MNPNNNRKYPHRRSIRYKGYDNSSEGVYFVTLVTKHHEHLFGKIENGEMVLNQFGRIVREEWFKTAILRPNIELNEDEFVVMPNHIHGIIWITEKLKEIAYNGHGTGDLQVARTNSSDSIRPKGPLSNSIGAIIGGFKAAATKRINSLRGTYSQEVWLRNYYEHIIESEREYFNIANYIHDNPENWGINDEYYSLW
ncbi:MAG TPA: transposase [Anaerolineaceae bacterium]|nr:transposase [Anaerolineaceae bacterium]